MTEPFIGEIQLFGFNFPPRGWASCNGATLAIQQNTALFSLLGIQYGGNGTTTFQLPNFTNRAGCNQGQGAGLTPRTIGQTFGSNNITLTQAEMPAHAHSLTIYNQSEPSKRAPSPSSGNGLSVPNSSSPFLPNVQPNTQFAQNVIGVAGSSQPHENRQPYLAINFSIALAGIFPSFS
ncbi:MULTISPECIES: tail fiber protein [unclassified Phyllobacterium]|uniref:phage tail protein n=1 Tax=Phyllobacterium TaxID=28100 RepID=UPI000DD7A443|nr:MULTISPECIES: tail fiber protein [unclassified Phyllobacterium]MBA8903843.1 microcystin-dependent protein [Phyllobacterium sp. P30BS-XVII]UGX88459.1 tail fiber protein [Phyllobacterium sp. T1293]